jgi:hypothetical protein
MNYTVIKSYDGFGAQYQKSIQTYIFCKLHNLNFLYRPFDTVEHNYENDISYNDKLEELINLKTNIENISNKKIISEINFNIIITFFDNNVDLCCDNLHMKFIKDCYWENKNRNFFENDKFNIAIHIRRENIVDNGKAGERVTTPNSYYINIMNQIRRKYREKNILFHIYSQGNIDNFKEFENNDVIFNINDDIIKTFMAFVSANILVISPSSFSYVAALISDGEVYYKKFWHNPKKNWILS